MTRTELADPRSSLLPESMNPQRQRIFERLSRRFSVEPVTPDRLGPLCAFFKRAYADQPVAAAFREEAQILDSWKWRYEQNPVSESKGNLAWMALKNGEIIGHFAVLPALAVIQKQTIPICWGSSLIVAPKWRNQGAGPLLILTAVAQSRCPFLIAGINENVYPTFKRLGFLDRGALPLYLKLFQPHRFAETLPWSPVSRRAAGTLLAAAGRLRKQGTPRVRFSIVPLQRFDDQFDRWWKSIESTLGSVVRRTSATMAWRYLRHPHHDYSPFAAMDGRHLRGVVIVRTGSSRGLPAGFISELLTHPDDSEVQQALLAHAEAFLLTHAKKPLALIRSTVLHRNFSRSLLRRGFLRVPSPIHWMLTRAEGNSTLGPITRRQDWFLNAGDSDLDMV